MPILNGVGVQSEYEKDNPTTLSFAVKDSNHWATT